MAAKEVETDPNRRQEILKEHEPDIESLELERTPGAKPGDKSPTEVADREERSGRG